MNSTVNQTSGDVNKIAPPLKQNFFDPYVIPISILVNLILGIACLSVTANLLSLDTRFDSGFMNSIFSWIADLIRTGGITDLHIGDFGNLGRTPQDFVGLIILIPVCACFYGSLLLIQRKPAGRFITLAVQYFGAVLSFVAVLHFGGVFLSFEAIVDGIMENQAVLLGIPFTYAIFWISGRFSEDSRIRKFLENLTLIIGMIAVIALVWFSDVLGSTNLIQVSEDKGAWIALALSIVLGFLGWRLLLMADVFGETPQQRVAWQGWLMLSPNIIGFTLFFAGPLLLSFYLSFTDSTVGQVPNIIGFDNYAEILSLEIQTMGDGDANTQDAMSFGYSVLGTLNIGGEEYILGAKDARFWKSLRNTIVFCLMLVPFSTIPALGLAMILNSKLPGMKFFRALYFLPSVAAVVGTALIWRWLYDPTIGYFNYVIRGIVDFLNSTLGMGLTDPNIEWLSGPGVVLFSIVFLASWQVVGFNTVLFLAGLQNIPKTLYEAAMIDGANKWAQFRNVTLPMLAPTTFFVITTTMITGLQVFNEPFTLFPSRPIPIQATTSVFYIYNQGFNSFEFGYASSVAWILFLIIFMVTFVQFRMQRGGAYED